MRFPYFWEDDLEMLEDKNWNLSESSFQELGINFLTSIQFIFILIQKI